MIKETHMSGGNSVGGSKCGDKPPKVNLLQHANAHDSFSAQNKFLSSNFLYSLPTQKRNSEVSARARLMACRVLNLQRVQTTQADKAWQVLSSGQFSCRNYVKPGKTVPVVKDINDKSSQNVRKTTLQSPSYMQNNIPGCMQIHKNSSGTNAKLNEPAKCTGSSLPFHPSNVAETGKVAKGQNEGYTPTCNRFHAQATNGIFSNRIVSTSQAKGSGGTSPDCIDDDDILENIDVDQIVMEHYQSTCTPQPSISKLPPVTPTVDKNNFVRDEETCLPSELCLSCNHGFMLGLCPEASNHLQDMKDKLIALSNELLDNVADLSSNEIEKLRQERLQLNKQVQQLEKYLRSTSVDEERQKSQFSASTAPPRAFQYETPQAVCLYSNTNRR